MPASATKVTAAKIPLTTTPFQKVKNWFAASGLESRQIQASGLVCHGSHEMLGRGNKPESLMQAILDLLATRRSVKSADLTEPGPTADELSTLLRAASRVPDHGKLVPWRFIVFQGDARLKAGEIIAAAFRENYPNEDASKVAIEGARLAQAPLVIAVVSRAAPHVKIPEWEQVLSSGAAAMNLIIAAHGFGYAANWITGWYAYDRRVLAGLGLAAHERISGFIHVGTATRQPEDRPRPPLNDIVTYFPA